MALFTNTIIYSPKTSCSVSKVRPDLISLESQDLYDKYRMSDGLKGGEQLLRNELYMSSN